MASDIYIKMGDDIKGESTDEKHKDWIEVLSFNHGLTNTVTMGSGTGSRGVGRADFQDMSFSKVMDKATADLNLHCATGKHIPKVEIQCCVSSDKKEPYMVYTLEDVAISSISVGGSKFDESKPTENITLAFANITWKYTAYKHDGSKDGDFEKSYDLRENKGK